jgi:hypothetical protein
MCYPARALPIVQFQKAAKKDLQLSLFCLTPQPGTPRLSLIEMCRPARALSLSKLIRIDSAEMGNFSPDPGNCVSPSSLGKTPSKVCIAQKKLRHAAADFCLPTVSACHWTAAGFAPNHRKRQPDQAHAQRQKAAKPCR